MDANKIIKGSAATLLSLTAILGAVWGLDSHFATAADLATKADAATVAAFQKELLRDRKDELELQIYKLEHKTRSAIEDYELTKLKSRLADLEKALGS